MSTDQKYDGKESHANSPKSIEQTANQADQPTPSLQEEELSKRIVSDQVTDQPAAPTTVELPFFLNWQVQDAERTKNLLGAIEKVFYEFDISETGKKISEEDFNKSLAYTGLRISFMELVEKAAIKQGALDKPRASDYLFTSPMLATGDKVLDESPVLMDNPFDTIDVGALQEWVRTLQQMARLQQKINLNNTEINALQKDSIGALKTQVDAYKRAEIQRQKREEAPDSFPYVDLTLYIHNGAESELELVRQVLADARDAKLDEMLGKLVVDETEDAFFVYEDYRSLRNIHDRLSSEAIELASNNYSKVRYLERSAHYLREEKADHEKLMTRKGAFVDKYSVFTISEEKDEPATGSTDTAAPTDTTEQTLES